MPIRITLFLLLSTFIFWGYSGQIIAQGQVLPVTNLNESGPGSLRAVTSFAQAGDTVFLQTPGTIRLDSQIFISKNLVIAGNDPLSSMIGANGATRLFEVDSADTVVFRNLALIDGDAYEYVAPEPRGGGAIRTRGRIELFNCLLENNQAVIGGALLLEAFDQKFPSAYLENCTFIRNRALDKSSTMELGNGGAIYTDARMMGEGRINAVNCTFTQNHAGLSGGAIYLLADPAGGASFNGEFCTITRNVAQRCGGIDNSQAEVGFLGNSLVAENTGELIRPDLFGTWRSNGHNLIADTNGIQFALGSPQTTDLIGIDPKLGPVIRDESGHVGQSLSCGSPAIDAAAILGSPVTDGRGKNRDANPDIGSWERLPSDLQINNLNDQGANALRTVLQLACPGDTLDMGNLTGVLTLSQTLNLFQPVSIIGNNQNPLIIDGGDSTRLFDVQTGVEASLSWMTLRRGGPDLFGGGAIRNKGRLRVANSTFRLNKAQAGGAVANYGEGDTATFEAINCTFAQNQAVVLDGGAIDNRFITHPAVSRLVHCTISENTAASRGGGIFNQGSQPDTLPDRVDIQGTLIANNTAFEGEDLYGNFQSLGTNLIKSENGYQLTTSSTELTGVDPQLDSLGNYGGPTFTFRLKTISPAIDAAANFGLPAIDQRGFPRIFNGDPDIGAYEYDPATSIFPREGSRISRIFPQPAKDWLTIEFAEPVIQGQLKVYDLQGRLCLERLLSRAESVKLPIGVLPPGLFLLQVYADSEVWNHKILIH